MKTRKKTRVSFSADGRAVDVTLPKSWTELTQQELRTVYRLMSSVPSSRLALLVFFSLSGAEVRRHVNGAWLIRFRSHRSHRDVLVTADEMVSLISCLGFLGEPGDVPVRPDTIRRAQAVDSVLRGVPFGEYLRLENLYQGFLASHNPSALLAMAQTLYPGLDGTPLSAPEELCVLQWFVQVKRKFSRMFNDFFSPVESAPDHRAQMDIMNAQIRVLTQGDVTREAAVLAIDCWRALTELDALAREAREYKSKHPQR